MAGSPGLAGTWDVKDLNVPGLPLHRGVVVDVGHVAAIHRRLVRLVQRVTACACPKPRLRLRITGDRGLGFLKSEFTNEIP